MKSRSNTIRYLMKKKKTPNKEILLKKCVCVCVGGGGAGWGLCHVACRILVPQPGIEPGSPAES